MEKAYRTVKSSKFAGTVSRKAVAAAVRTLSESKDGLARARDSVADAPLSAAKAKSSALAASRLKKR